MGEVIRFGRHVQRRAAAQRATERRERTVRARFANAFCALVLDQAPELAAPGPDAVDEVALELLDAMREPPDADAAGSGTAIATAMLREAAEERLDRMAHSGPCQPAGDGDGAA